jgi:hypothetical protein
MIEKVEAGEIPFERRVQSLCLTPYYGHLHGCPNYGKKQGCPPNQPLIDEVLDFERGIYVVYTRFAVGEFAEGIRKKYPQWNERQIYNPRYWQPRARKLQREEKERAKKELGLEAIINSPEGNGVLVSQLMRNIGVELSWRWPPDHKNYKENFTYLVSLAGFFKQCSLYEF